MKRNPAVERQEALGHLVLLSQTDKAAIVDKELIKYISEHRWHLSRRDGYTYYAKRSSEHDPVTGKQITILMHRVIMEKYLQRSLEPNEFVDHINSNGLDNRIKNLRVVNRSLNNMNRRKFSEKSSQFKGVTWEKSSSTWRARIRKNGRLISLGRHKSEVSAAHAYDYAAILVFGEHARLNFQPLGAIDETRY